MDLDGRTALITGGGSGLGRAIAERLARDGADTVILTLPAPAFGTEVKHFADSAEAGETAERVRALGRRAAVVEGDVASGPDLDRAVAAAQTFGGVDILVNNAATNARQRLLDHDEQTWRRVLDVNLTGAFLAIRACLSDMITRGFGRIVSIASTDAHQGAAGYAAYCASKHGLLGLSRSLAKEVDGLDITANTISPSWLNTPSARLHLRLAADERGVSVEQELAELTETLPQRRLIDVEEVAAVVSFLCGSEGRAIHGADVLVTAGAAR
jgi:NAD(P)-dependent dehydrogenase (short-subunit alcohol dehydrogenase family)